MIGNAINPRLDVITAGLPSGPTRGRSVDWLAFQIGKLPYLWSYRARGRSKRRPHRHLLEAAIEELLRVFPNPVCLETGCTRSPKEGTESTLAISSALRERGQFYSFELEMKHIEICRAMCGPLADHIHFVQGDSEEMLAEYAQRSQFDIIHFAFLDSAANPDHTFAEFRAIEHRFTSGSVVIVDDAVRGNKGGRIKPYLHAHRDWATRLVYAGNGLLIAVKKPPAG